MNPNYSLPPLDSPYFSDLEEVLASVGPDKSDESLTISDSSHILDGPVSIDTNNGVSEQVKRYRSLGYFVINVSIAHFISMLMLTDFESFRYSYISKV